MRKIYFYVLILFVFPLTQCKKKSIIEADPIPIEETKYPGSKVILDGLVLKISMASGSSDLPENEIEKSYDGDINTIYQAPIDANGLPDTLTYTFPKAENVDYLTYTPRANGEDGLWGRVEIWYLGKSKALYEKIGNYDFEEGNKITTIEFPKPIKEALSFRIVVVSGKNNTSSAAEVTFCKKDGFSNVFTDNLLSDLRPNITIDDINTMPNPLHRNIAMEMLRGSYDKFFRIQEYIPYPVVTTTSKALKLSDYNQYENPTGVYFSSGSQAVILVGDTQGERLSLRVRDFNPNGDFNANLDQTYELQPGLNNIAITNNGLGYINFYTDKYKSLSPVKIHILNGKINGYFDKSKHKREDWSKLLNASVTTIFDIKGDYVNLAFSTAELKLYCNDGLELINIYDEITKMQFDIMGLTKYNKIPKNHMFARTVPSGLFADGIGAGFAKDSMHELANPSYAKTGGIWPIAHELGHVNQVRPGLRWVSTSEVTNNIYSVLARYHFTPNDLNLEQERVNDGDGNLVLGGRFNSFLNYGVVKGEQWLCQRGQDKMTGYENGGDHFVKLCPLWQLLLYYHVAQGTSWQKTNWFAEVAEIVRNTNEAGKSNGQLQLNFMRNVCDIVKEDLTDFFVKVGMLKPINKLMDDYTAANLTITQADCDQLVLYAKKYNKPKSPVIYYMTANSLEAYEKSLPVAGSFNQGVSVNVVTGTATINHSVWKNVTVFETYKSNELTKVAMVGTNSADKSTTLVRYPSGSTRIEAVSWDGQRTLVYGQR